MRNDQYPASGIANAYKRVISKTNSHAEHFSPSCFFVVRQCHISSHAQYARFETPEQAHHLLCSSHIGPICTKS